MLQERQVYLERKDDEHHERRNHIHAHSHTNRISAQRVSNPMGAEVHSGEHGWEREEEE